ncbi:hypothetical protein [uncultured Desulfosarcina sp.]|uniref:hypothetical protein n=1 Tax=uncultured Desulfosarcina sp. TaxID=218289 RepID=UPI0029C643CE|nr:hypothetical protein [uncultured Desulfosarcina sp.]
MATVIGVEELAASGLEALAKFSSIWHPHDTAHGERIDWIVSRNGQKSSAIRHDDVFLALPYHGKTGFFQSPDRV